MERQMEDYDTQMKEIEETHETVKKEIDETIKKDHEQRMKEIEENHEKIMKQLVEEHQKIMKEHESILERYAIQRQTRIQGRPKRKIYVGKVKTE